MYFGTSRYLTCGTPVQERPLWELETCFHTMLLTPSKFKLVSAGIRLLLTMFYVFFLWKLWSGWIVQTRHMLIPTTHESSHHNQRRWFFVSVKESTKFKDSRTTSLVTKRQIEVWAWWRKKWRMTWRHLTNEVDNGKQPHYLITKHEGTKNQDYSISTHKVLAREK